MEDWRSIVKSWFGSLAGNDVLWVVEVFIVVLATLVAAFVFSRFMLRLNAKAQLTKNLWDDAALESLARPMKWLIWVMGLSYAANIVAEVSQSFIFDSIESMRDIAAVIIVAWFFNGFLHRIEQNVVAPGYLQKPMDKTTAVALGKLLRISVTITAALIAIQSLGYSVSGVLAFGGIGGIAVGFAAKDLLANFFGGLMIYLDRPFSVGDWVRSPDKNIEGTVEDIGWRLTTIRTFDKRPLYVPNSTFTQISVENPSRMYNRRIYETIGIRYDDAKKMAVIVSDVNAMLAVHEEIDQNQMIMVNFNEFAASSMDFFIYCFTKTTDWAKYHQIKQDVLMQILTIVESHGAECAFPTSTLHVASAVPLQAAQGADVSSR